MRMTRVLLCSLPCLLSVLALVGCGGGSSGPSPLTSAQAVAAAKSALVIGFAAGDSAASVTQNLTLPVTGSNGSTITWASNNPAVISTAGTVAPLLIADASVTLTATITVDTASDTKLFPVTVKAQMTETQAVAAAKAALAIVYAEGDSATSVTQNLNLPLSGIDTSTIAWASDNPDVVTAAGVVTRPLTTDAAATLTATITVGSASDTKDFPVTIKPQMTDAQAVAAAKAALAIGYAPGDAATSVTQNLTLPLTGLDNCTVTWSSSDASLVSTSGVVSRPVTGDEPVTLTATITSHAATDTRSFIVTVKAEMTDAEAVAAAKAALTIGYAPGDSASTVTQNLALPLTGSSGCIVTWTSSDPSLVSTAGIVERPAYGDAELTLTATVASHAVSDTAAFTITVKGQTSDADAVAAAKAALNIVYAPGDSASNVTQSLTLPANGSDACTITWSSSDPSVISNTGLVTPPAGSDASITLTATIHSHAASDTKDFLLTVKAPFDDNAAVAADKAALTLGYGPGDSAARVRGNLVLPTSGLHGSSIAWSSSNPAIVSISGGVSSPSDDDASVILTATITHGAASDTADFPLTVKALLLSSWIDGAVISPGNGAIEVDPGIVIGIPFQRPLDLATVNDTTFQLLRTSDSQAVPVAIAYDDPSRTVTLTPQSPLAQATQYSIVVASTLLDADEIPLPSPMGFNFTTLSYEDILSQWKFNGDGADSSGHDNLFNNFSGTYDPLVVHEGVSSLYLNGAFQYGLSDISLGTQLTVAVWVNVDNPIQPSILTLLANTGTGEGSNGFKLGINRWGTSDQSVVIEVGNGTYGGKWTTAPGLIQPGNWYHLAFVIDQPNQVLKIYYNGAPAPLTFVSDEGRLQQDFQYDFKTAGPFTIGAFPPGMNYSFKGHLDDMRVYNRVLADDEIAKIAQEK